MNRILRGTVLLASTAVLWACNTEPDQVKGGTADHIVATPGVLFVAQGDSSAVLLRVVDQQGTSLHDPITITNSGAAIRVAPDSSFRPIFNGGDSLVFNNEGTELRVWVVANDKASTTFSVAAGGQTLDVPVTVIPASSDAFSFTTLTPALGEIVTVTAPADLLFTDSTEVLFGATTVTPSNIAADGSSLTFNVQPALVGPASFTNVTLSYNGNVVFTVQAADTLNSPPVTEDFTFSNLTPALGEVVTITPPAGVIFTDSTGISFDSLGPAPRYTVAGDGSSVSLEPGPNSVGPTTFTNLTDATNKLIVFTLKSSDTLVSEVVDTFKVNVSDNTPALGQFVTVTGATSLFRFSPKSKFAVGGRPALAWTIAADSNSASVLFEPGVDGNMSVDSGLVSLFKMGKLPSSQTITADEAAFMTGTDDFATAPAITDPATGDTTAFWDGGDYGHTDTPFGDGERLYKLVVGTGHTIKFQLPYISDGADLGVYFYDGSMAPMAPGGGFVVDNAGGGGSSGTANAESGNVTLAAGTYYVAIVYFNYAASPTPAAHYLFRMIGQ